MQGDGDRAHDDDVDEVDGVGTIIKFPAERSLAVEEGIEGGDHGVEQVGHGQDEVQADEDGIDKIGYQEFTGIHDGVDELKEIEVHGDPADAVQDDIEFFVFPG